MSGLSILIVTMSIYRLFITIKTYKNDCNLCSDKHYAFKYIAYVTDARGRKNVHALDRNAPNDMSLYKLLFN